MLEHGVMRHAARDLPWRPCARGFALIAALIALVLVSLSAVVAVQSARTQARRDREEQLLFVGDQYRLALRSYSLARPNGLPAKYPLRLQDLIEDRRSGKVVRHLRRLYADPVTRQFDWVLEVAGGGIVGLHSASAQQPLRDWGFSADDARFAKAQSYAGWHFESVFVDAFSEVSTTALMPDGTVAATPARP
jgi:type II secretory pathway pseudopilin PulG